MIQAKNCLVVLFIVGYTRAQVILSPLSDEKTKIKTTCGGAGATCKDSSFADICTCPAGTACAPGAGGSFCQYTFCLPDSMMCSVSDYHALKLSMHLDRETLEHAAPVSVRPRQVKHWLHVLLQLLQQQQLLLLLLLPLQLPPQPQQQRLSLTLAQQQQQPHAPQLMVPLQVLSACFPSSSG